MMEPLYSEMPKDVIEELMTYHLLIDGGGNFSFSIGNEIRPTYINKLELDVHPNPGLGIRDVIDIVERIHFMDTNGDTGTFGEFCINLGISLRNKFIGLIHPQTGDGKEYGLSPKYYEENFLWNNYLMTPVSVAYMNSVMSVTPSLMTGAYSGLQTSLETVLTKRLWDTPVENTHTQAWWRSGY